MTAGGRRSWGRIATVCRSDLVTVDATVPATFYRNYAELIGWFKQQLHEQQAARPRDTGAQRRDSATEIARLRRENEDLRALTKLYAEAIRQLTLDRAELEAVVTARAGVTILDTRRQR